LAHDGELVGVVEACVLFVEGGFGSEVGEVEGASSVGDAAAQDVDGAVGGDLFADALEESGAVLAAGVLGLKLLESSRLGGVEEPEEDVSVEAEMAVELIGSSVAVVGAEEGVFDGGLEVEL
jgi:hypothetical protein